MSERSIQLCVRMLQYAVWADHTQNRRPSEVKEALKFFFTDEELGLALLIITGRAEPPFPESPCQHDPMLPNTTIEFKPDGLAVRCLACKSMWVRL